MTTASLLSALCLGLPALAGAQAIPPDCRPVIAAEKKQIMTPTHAYTTRGEGKAQRVDEVITTSGAMYVLTGGSWKKLPQTQKDMLDRLNLNLAHTRGYACQRLGDESIAGTSATVYQAHAETDDVKSDGKVWVAKDSGLILRQDSDIDSGAGDPKIHMSIRYEYANVQAPAGVR